MNAAFVLCLLTYLAPVENDCPDYGDSEPASPEFLAKVQAAIDALEQVNPGEAQAVRDVLDGPPPVCICTHSGGHRGHSAADGGSISFDAYELCRGSLGNLGATILHEVNHILYVQQTGLSGMTMPWSEHLSIYESQAAHLDLLAGQGLATPREAENAHFLAGHYAGSMEW